MNIFVNKYLSEGKVIEEAKYKRGAKDVWSENTELSEHVEDLKYCYISIT